MKIKQQSGYIDPEEWHKNAPHHKYFKETWAEIANFIKRHSKNKKIVRILEYGAGTGLLTLQLSKIKNAKINAVEIDSNYISILKENVSEQKNVKVIREDAITYRDPKTYDFIASSTLNHHIAPKFKIKYLNNAFDNLKPGGAYLLGDEFIPNYKSNNERKLLVTRWYSYILNDAKRKRKMILYNIESRALQHEIEGSEEYKTSPRVFERTLRKSKFTSFKKVKMGPKQNIGGLYVYVLKKQNK